MTKLQLIVEWKKVLRFWSVQLAIVGSALTALLIAVPDAAIYVWGMLPADLKALIPENYTPLIGVGVFALSVIARVIKQTKLSKPNVKTNSDS